MTSGHGHRAVASPFAAPSVLSAGALPRFAVAAGLLVLLWLAVWWALSA